MQDNVYMLTSSQRGKKGEEEKGLPECERRRKRGSTFSDVGHRARSHYVASVPQYCPSFQEKSYCPPQRGGGKEEEGTPETPAPPPHSLMACIFKRLFFSLPRPSLPPYLLLRCHSPLLFLHPPHRIHFRPSPSFSVCCHYVLPLCCTT